MRLAAVVGVAALALLPVAVAAEAPCEWQARRVPQPPGPPAVVVTGLCTMPTPGFTIALTRMTPRGANPSTLLLHRAVTAPTGIVAQVRTPIPALYREGNGEKITQVMILPDHVSIPVQDVK
jgi:hypothetical protein